MEIPKNQGESVFFGEMVLKIMENAPLQLTLNNDPFRTVICGGNPYPFQAKRFMLPFFTVVSPEKIDSNSAHPSAKATLEMKAHNFFIGYNHRLLG